MLKIRGIGKIVIFIDLYPYFHVYPKYLKYLTPGDSAIYQISRIIDKMLRSIDQVRRSQQYSWI